MENDKMQNTPIELGTQEAEAPPCARQAVLGDPKLAFVKPKLTKHGSLKEVTGEGFFGGFSPK
jgi:hypothetical protein